MFHVKQFDVLIIGGGHAGCEAALAAARMGSATLLLSMDPSKIAEMSCNPSIGGVGKGQLVKEIDALGGEMGINADYTGIQFKRLNTRKGGAVQSSRCQSDKKLYAQRMQSVIRETPNLTVVEAEVKAILIEAGRVVGARVRTKDGRSDEFATKTVVITAGTFMRGLMHCGDEKTAGGRFGEEASQGLSGSLKDLGFELLRLKTGTPPRLIEESIDFGRMERQDGDTPPRKFSFWGTEIPLPQRPCFLTYTNDRTHGAIRDNLSRSPLYSGMIKGIGPRYCPSIEDKVVKFPDKSRHPLFFEPEALDSNWIYPNGVSTSLPADVQEAFIRTIPGCEEVKFARYGYAVEYDCVDPRQLHRTLESRPIGGLFFAGQVNGTSGYEEAAAQGLMAGINASRQAQGDVGLVLSRSEAYIGVMIDDLVSLGITEPYRMFTSRAEFRLMLREDNADARLSRYGREIGLLSQNRYDRYLEKRAAIDQRRAWMGMVVKPSDDVQAKLAAWGSQPLYQPQTMLQILKRPEVDLDQVATFSPTPPEPLSDEAKETLEIEVKYEGYIAMQKDEIERLRKLSHLEIPNEVNYSDVTGLSIEVREKLNRLRPGTLAEAAKISGVTPSAMTAILFHLRQKAAKGAAPIA